MSNRLCDIRAGAARLCDDWVKFVATQNSASTNVLIDELAGYENDKHFRGSEFWFHIDAGTVGNRGKQVRCIDSDRDLASVTFGSGLVSSPVSGDEAWAFNIGGEGARIRTYDAYINDAIRSLGPASAPVYSEVLATAWDNTISWIDIPATFTHIGEVQYLDANSNYSPIPSYGITIDFENKRLAINPDFGDYANGYTIRINGRKAHTTLTADTDTTDVDYEWLTNYVASRVLLNARDQLKVNRGGMYANAAEALRAKAGPFSIHGELMKVR